MKKLLQFLRYVNVDIKIPLIDSHATWMMGVFIRNPAFLICMAFASIILGFSETNWAMQIAFGIAMPVDCSLMWLVSEQDTSAETSHDEV